jgi:hypothetical protein
VNKRAFFFLLLLAALPAQAHHTKEHVLGAPPAPVATAPVAPDDSGGSRLLWALGPFFLLVGVGALRWGYRHHRDNKDKIARD